MMAGEDESLTVSSEEFLADPAAYVKKAETVPVRVERDGKVVLSFGTFYKGGQLWEILVPTVRDGKPVRTRSHKEWDARVRRIAGGLTILKPAKGQWINPCDGELFEERMIPVRIMCSDIDIEKIADMTAEFYKQKAVMYYLVSKAAFVRYYDEDGKPKPSTPVRKQKT